MQRRAFLRSSLVVSLGFAGSACGGGGGAAPKKTSSSSSQIARFAKYEAADEPNGDLAKVVWPSYVTNAAPEVKTLYEFQITHGELMKYMPCFCGCGANSGHKSNRDCYVKHVASDGSVVLDPMAPT